MNISLWAMWEAGPMTAALIITISLMVLFVAVSAGLWARRPGVRPVMGGLGLVLIPLGLYLFGLIDLAYNGVVSIIDWAQRTLWTTTMTWGASLVGVGLLLFLISRFVRPAQRKVGTQSESPAVATAPVRRPGSSVAGTPQPAVTAAPKQEKKTTEDAEVEDILRKRGLL